MPTLATLFSFDSTIGPPRTGYKATRFRVLVVMIIMMVMATMMYSLGDCNIEGDSTNDPILTEASWTQ